jgi:NitT/TauT family transport system substrate-binding protein
MADLKVRIGYFPNITHAHALIAQNMARDGKGWFEERVPGVKLEWYSFNAGPSAMEAMFAKSIDITYVGPSPALNAHMRSQGQNVRVVSGAMRGGAALVVKKGSNLKEFADFKGKRIATPQLGNTQDVACRYWLGQAGLDIAIDGGDVDIIPTQNSAILPLFMLNKIDAAWTVEPWVSRLEMSGGGEIIFSESAADSITTILVSDRTFLERRRDVLRKIAEAHMELTDWIINNATEAQYRVTDEISIQTKREFPLELVQHAWPRLVFDSSITKEDFHFSINAAKSAGFLKEEPDISNLVLAP